MPTSLFTIVIGLLPTLLLGSVESAIAQSDPMVTSSVACIAQVGTSGVTDTVNGAIIRCGDIGVNVGPEGVVPAVVQAEAAQLGPTLTALGYISSARLASGAATARFFAKISPLSPPPSPTAFVPILWTSSFDFMYADLETASASGVLDLGITIPQQGGAQDSIALSGPLDPPSSLSLEVPINFFLSQQPAPEIALDVATSCQLDGAAFGSGTCRTTAIVALIFDQVAFDQAMGPDTYDLEEFFIIEIIVDLPEPTPVPMGSAPMWLILGLLLVGGWGITHRARRL
jgi:hypothetical protein